MRKGLILKAEIREHAGSKHAARLRKKGRIPAVVYGHKQKPMAISLDAHDFVEGLHQRHRLMDVQIDKSPQKMIVKDLQYDHFGKDIIHVDLMRVDVTELVRVTVPIELKGTAKGTHEGGVLQEHTDRLEIECKATDIPESIVVSVKDMGIGDALHAGDIELGEGLKLVSSPSTLLVTCSIVAAAEVVEEVGEEPTVPEVIGEVEAAEEEAGEVEGE